MKLKKWFEISLQNLVLLGIVVAMDVVLSKISFGPATVQIGLGFIGSVMLGYFFSPVWSAIGGGFADLVTSAIFGQQGGFFIGFTLTAMLGPMIYSFFFYQKPIKIWRIVAAVLLVTVIVNVFLNTLWIHIMYGLDFRAALIQRAPKELIVPWIQMVVIYFVLEALSRVKIKK